MLLIPLHKRLDRDTVPWVTLALVLANVFVFVFLQGGDTVRLERATAVYRAAALADREGPTIVRELESRGESAVARLASELPEPFRSRWLVDVLAWYPAIDGQLSEAARQAAVSKPGDLWAAQRAAFEREMATLFTPRHVHRYDDPWSLGLLTAVFLHADPGHLIGNMVFLVLLGLMTEGALGRLGFLLAYLAAGVGGSAFAALLNAGSDGAALGASGAIAGLMGVLAVVWGLRRVRVFWWFFVAFGYRAVPAIALLPVWLGWELWNHYANPGLGIGFDAHAGGIMSGALLAAGVRLAGRERRDFLDREIEIDRRAGRVDELRGAIGRLDFASAEALAEELAATRPDDLDTLELIVHAQQARFGGARWAEALGALLAHPARPGNDEVERQRRVILDAQERGAALSPPLRAAIGVCLDRWIAIGALEASLDLVDRLRRDRPLDAALAQPAFRLALRFRDRGQPAMAERVEDLLLADQPGSPEAAKVRSRRALGGGA
jgi:membrane associated rhomboid family serine protease